MTAPRPRSARSIATRTGDDGTTSLLYGQRVPKHHPQIEAVGALDELNVAIGFAKATRPAAADAGELERIQRELVGLMGEVSCAEADAQRYADSKFAKIGEAELARIDDAVEAIEARQPKFDGWATPGANVHAAALDPRPHRRLGAPSGGSPGSRITARPCGPCCCCSMSTASPTCSG